MTTDNPPIRSYLIAGLVAIAIGAAALFLVRPGTVTPSEPAPEFTLPDFDGNTVQLTDFRGQPLVINYWASWCAPCLAEMPGFEAVYQKHRPEVAFLGINLADDPVGAAWVIDNTGITYPVAVDREGTSFTAFGGFGMPTTVFIDPDGYILEMVTGPLTTEELDDRIEKYFLES